MVEKLTFCQRFYHEKCQWSGVGGQKSQNLVNVVCERPLIGKICSWPKSILPRVGSNHQPFD